MTATDFASPGVVLTDRAAKRVSRILSKEPEGTVLRISVAGGGCSGFQYEYNLVQEKPASDDIVLSKGDAVVLIDSMSLEFMGGSEINLTQADFNGTIRIDTTNIFGGTKLFVPANWDVQSEVVAIFGGVDDKRHLNGHAIDPKKVLIIEGTCLFGGIDIRSF